MPINQYTKIACGSLITSKPFQIWNPESYTNITAAQVAAITARPEGLGAWNIASNVPNGPNFDIVLHEVRLKLAVDAPSRPSWAAIGAAETTMIADAATAVVKRNAIYTTYNTPVLGLVGSLLSSLTNSQQRDLWVYSKYMNSNGVKYNAKGRILGFEPNSKAPMEFSYLISEDGVWIVVTANPQWTDFIT